MDIRHTTSSIFKEIVQTALISFAIFFLVYIFLVQPHRVKGESMAPNFANGELILTEKVSFRFEKPKRGDVVVFRAPTAQKVDFIKRIVGLPGETTTISDGIIFINGQKLEEPYEIQKTEGEINVTLGENQYFVLGDNRRSSSDSRTFGPINKKALRGRSWLVYWPIFKSSEGRGARIISRVDYGISDSF
ncbi:signal peptidase I [Candidatus Curtissbacteria bacterium]|nr:signal peptidase I [Candidatus Curtissbacteria bacterium]